MNGLDKFIEANKHNNYYDYHGDHNKLNGVIIGLAKALKEDLPVNDPIKTLTEEELDYLKLSLDRLFRGYTLLEHNSILINSIKLKLGMKKD